MEARGHADRPAEPTRTAAAPAGPQPGGRTGRLLGLQRTAGNGAAGAYARAVVQREAGRRPPPNMPAALDEVSWDELFDQVVPQALRAADWATAAKGVANVVDVETKNPLRMAGVHLKAGTAKQFGETPDGIIAFHSTVKENLVVDGVYFCVRDYFEQYPDLEVEVTEERIREEYRRYKRRAEARRKKERDRQFVTVKGSGGGGGEEDVEEEEHEEQAEPGVSNEEPAPGPAGAPEPATHVVQRGENLWVIAEAHLGQIMGSRPDELQVRAYWKQLVATNRHLLSDPSDPSFVRPGLEIALPTLQLSVASPP